MMVTDTPLVKLQAEKSYNRQVISWAWYDWANHAYITTTASAFFPPYFIAIAAAAFLPAGANASDAAALALARDTASNVFALMVSLALFVAAILAPVVGAYADITGQRKRLLITATIVASLFSSLMFVLTTGMWVLGLVLYFITQVAMNIALGSPAACCRTWPARMISTGSPAWATPWATWAGGCCWR